MMQSVEKSADRRILFGGLSGAVLLFFFVVETYRDHSYMIMIVRYMHLIAFSTLARAAWTTRSCAGFSMHSLCAYFLATALRCASTFSSVAYRSGDSWVEHMAYNGTEALNLIVLAYLVITTGMNRDYRPSADRMNALVLLSISLVLGYFSYSDLDGTMYVDWLWMSSMILEALAIVPQLFLFVKTDEVRPILSNYVMLLMVTKVASFLFWFGYYWVFFKEDIPVLLFCKRIVYVELLNVLVMADYAYLYAGTWKKQGFGLPLILPAK